MAAADAPANDDAELITLNFPENVELKVLIDYVSQRLGMNILYDEQIVATHVTIRSPTRITRDSLPGLLETILKMRGLVLVDAEPAGWKRIVRADDMAGVARPSDRPREDLPQLKPAEVLTQVIQLRHTGAKQCQSIIEPLLTNPGGKIARIEEQQLLIITDYAETLARVTGLAAMLDRPRQAVVTADPNNNSIIVIADPAMQAVYDMRN